MGQSNILIIKANNLSSVVVDIVIDGGGRLGRDGITCILNLLAAAVENQRLPAKEAPL